MFYDNLKEACENEGLTVTEVMKDLSISQKTYYNWKKTGATPRKKTIDEISQFLGTSIEFLLRDVDLTKNQEEMVKRHTTVREVHTYCNRGIQKEGQKKKESRIVDAFMDDIREILVSCNNRQRCELMQFIYEYKDSMDK